MSAAAAGFGGAAAGFGGAAAGFGGAAAGLFMICVSSGLLEEQSLSSSLDEELAIATMTEASATRGIYPCF
jgi:hypothetical protein